MSTLPCVELGVLGPLQVRQDGAPVAIPGAKPRAILTMLGLHSGSVVSAETLIQLLWDRDPPRTADKALQTHISALRRTLGDGLVLTEGTGWTLAGTEVDASRYTLAARLGRHAAAAGDTGQAVARLEEALALWRGTPELPDSQRGVSEKTRWIERHAALIEDRADALLVTGRAAEIIGELEAAVADAPLRERRWGQLMLALYRAGRQGDALGAYQRARALLVDELGIDPGPELRRLEAAIVAQDSSLDTPVAQHLPSVMRAVTFLLTDIEGSTAAWEADADAMAVALARHDELVEQVVTSRGGKLIKTRGEGDATFSVFDRPSAAASAALELQDAIGHEPWELRNPMRVRVALHTGEVELRDGDYFGRAVNRAARLRSLAEGGQILCSGATAELVIDTLPDDVLLTDLGMRKLKNLPRPEHVFELRLETAEDGPELPTGDAPMERPGLPAVLIGPGPFVGRGHELEQLLLAWQTTLTGGAHTVLLAGEPGVGKTRLAGEWSQRAYELGAVVLYGRCDEDLGAPYQPFAEALRSLVPCLGAGRLRAVRGVEALLSLVPGLADVLPDVAPPARSDPDTERYALFDAVVAALEVASAAAPVMLILDDLHWAAKPTLLLLRHLLRFGDRARVQIVGTYRNTDLDRSHPLAATLADLHRDGTADRLNLSGLAEDDVTAYVAEAGYDDEELAHALASVTGGNPFFLIEALRHVDESGGVWDQSTLPQGVREAVSRRLSRLPAETNKALAAAAVVGSRFALDLVEQVVEQDLIDAFDEACKAGIIIEEPGGRYRFNHALVRQSLLAELPSVRRMRLHQRIATTLETQPVADDELLAELAYHYFECAWAGNAVKAVEYCRRAADQAMTRLAYEGAADLYDRALHALEEIDDELPDRADQVAELLVARCEALLAAGDVTSAVGAVSQLQDATVDSVRLSAWATCFNGELSMLIHPERLDEVEAALATAASRLAELDDAAGEAKAHTVRAGCLARLGRIGDGEVALDDALTAARRAGEHRRVNAVLANAPLAALWGPNPVPRAGGRCLDVVRLLRITTDSPAVEATSTRCQAVLEAFRGRTSAARRMIDSARRSVTELGLRHALVEVEQFAGIVELVADDPAAAEPHLRKAYNGFRRMGLDADTAETAALLGRTCLALDRDVEADELCTESERLAGHALKASIAWRTLRAKLLARQGDHAEARRVAEAAVSLAEHTDALVDHGDACLSLAIVLEAAGDLPGARAAAERAVDLYERKGAAALAERSHNLLGRRVQPVTEARPEAPSVEPDNAAVRVGERVMAAVHHGAWDEFERLFAPGTLIESRRKIVGLTLPSDEWRRAMRRELETGGMRVNHAMVAARGERLALSRMEIGPTEDVGPGAPYDELLHLYGIDEEGRVALQMFFDVDDIDAALAELDAVHARFERETAQVRKLENTAARVFREVWSHYGDRNWDAMAATVAEDYVGIDRRVAVKSDTQHGRADAIRDLQGSVDVGLTLSMLSALAIRGERLVLAHVRAAGQDPDAIRNDVVNVVEIDADERIATVVVYELDDFDSAIAELDRRYLAGEAAAYARTWSAITSVYAMFNRHEPPPVDWVNVDHRQGSPFSSEELTSVVRTVFEVTPDFRIHIENVHRLNDFGAVITHASRGSSHEGVDFEYRMVQLLTVEGDRITRLELFDEEDLDAALAQFELLSRPAPKLENTASRVADRFAAHVAAHDWGSVEQTLATGFSIDDRRRVVNGGIRFGRDAEIKDLQASAEVGLTTGTSVVIATRSARLVLGRSRYSTQDQPTDAFHSEFFNLVEIDADERIGSVVVFDVDDFDSAVAELDRRFLVGEAAPYASTWSVIAGVFATFNRHEFPAEDWATVDHRQGSPFTSDDLTPALHTLFDLTPDFRVHIEAVHRLNNFGAVITCYSHGSSQQGLAVEWRMIQVLTVQGGRIARCELFDEADLDAAVARFEELGRPAPRLENAASLVYERFWSLSATHDWEAVGATIADEFWGFDHRRVVNEGSGHGRDAVVANMKAASDVGFTISAANVMATRGGRLALTMVCASGRDPETVQADALNIVEIDEEERMTGVVVFDVDDFNAAIAELDRRYLVGEAAAHAGTWSTIAASYAALNDNEFPAVTGDWVNIDHRGAAAFGPDDLDAYRRAGLNRGEDVNVYVEAVHRLTDLGALITYAAHETSHEGFDAEWRGVAILLIDGAMVSRSEIFDDAELDSAIERYDELSRPEPRLVNAASRLLEKYLADFAVRDWDAMEKRVAEDFLSDDRRRVANAGIRRGRDAEMANWRATSEVWMSDMNSSVVATRGERLALARFSFTSQASVPEAFQAAALAVVEINDDNRFAATVVFDTGDIDAAFAELDARYLAGEAAPYARVWQRAIDTLGEANRHQPGPMLRSLAYTDHRRISFGGQDFSRAVEELWGLVPDARYWVSVIHALEAHGIVCSFVIEGTDVHGGELQWTRTVVQVVDEPRFEVYEEDDVDAALARLEELRPQARRLENAASRAYQRFVRCYHARDWDAISAMVADDMCHDDRRRIVSAGVRHGRDAQLEDMRVMADMGLRQTTTDVIAIRGERLFLSRIRGGDAESQPQTSLIEVVDVVEVDGDGRLVTVVSFDPDDMDAAFAELDARYVAGEAAAHAHTWSVIAKSFISMNRRELPATTPDCKSVDHRRAAAFAPGDVIAYIQAGFDLDEHMSRYFESVHRLNDVGAVVTYAAQGTSRGGLDAEWRGVTIYAIEGDMFSRVEIFDEADLDAAIARFDQLHTPLRRLENAATLVNERIWACFETRDWQAMKALFADEMVHDDRRRVVGAGVLRGRDAQMEDMRSVAEIVCRPVIDVIATRGERLALTRAHFTALDSEPEPFASEMFAVIESDANDGVIRMIAFDLDSFDAAVAELDARYLAGEAAPYARTWQFASDTLAEVNRHEVGPVLKSLAYSDHRRVPFAAEDFGRAVEALWSLVPDARYWIPVIHALDTHGIVASLVIEGTDVHGGELQWTRTLVQLLDEPRFEVYEEDDVDAALAKFEELRPRVHGPHNAASRVGDRLVANLVARDWAALTEILAEGISTDDRRGVVGSGIRRGRDAEIRDLQAIAGLELTNVTATHIATRGERLVLTRVDFAFRDQGAAAFRNEVLGISEINADERIAALVSFGPDEMDAAFAELDARYLAGEAAAHADVWSVVAGVGAGFNRHELPATTPNPDYVDHRQLAWAEGIDLAASIRGIWDVTSDANVYIEAVHRLSDHGAVITQVLKMTSKEGFDAELPMIYCFTVDGDLISGVEVFDLADLDAALARFEELRPQALRLENAASRASERHLAHLAARDLDALAATLTDAFYLDDRRRVVNAGVLRGRDTNIENARAVAEVGFTLEMTGVIATRGERVALMSLRASARDSDAIQADVLSIVEIDGNGRLTAALAFDVDDFASASAELDARYLAGEAAPQARAWSVIAKGYAALNRGEVPPTTTDFVDIDHRPVAVGPGDLRAYLRTTLDEAVHDRIYVEAVHRLTDIGAVITHKASATSREGFDAEWSMVSVLTVQGDLLSGTEIFAEADLDAALTRFEELQPQTQRLENATSRASDRFLAHFAAGDWDSVAGMLAEGYLNDDRRRVVGSGVRHGRDAEIEDLQAIADLWTTKVTSTVIATRGARLALSRFCFPDRHHDTEAFRTDVLTVVETNADERIVAVVSFDVDDFDAAFEELDARYLAGEAAPYSRAWSVIADACAGFNRHELPPTGPAVIDHRQLAMLNATDPQAAMRGVWDVTPHLRIHIEAVHRLSSFGALATYTAHGTSPEGFDAQWRMIYLPTVEGDRIIRNEIFDEEDLDAALARFEELDPPRPCLANDATRIWAKIADAFNHRDLEEFFPLSSPDAWAEDRRQGLRAMHDGPECRKAAYALFEAAPDCWQMEIEPIATRASQLALVRQSYRDYEIPERPITAEMLTVIVASDDGVALGCVNFDPDDIDAAFEELDARYLAGEAAAHAQTWSVIMRTYAAFNRHELPATGLVSVDHRRGIPFESSDLAASIRESFDVTPDLSIRIEAVHRLSSLGVVVTHTSDGTSQEGFHAEWRMIQLLTVERDRIGRIELFDEPDLDTALARFEELQPQRLENAVSRVVERFWDRLATQDWAAMADTMADDFSSHDRRRVVNAGVLRGRDANIANMRAVAEVGFEGLTSTVIATRGQRLALARIRSSAHGFAAGEISADMLGVFEIGADTRLTGGAIFDADDIDAAYADLDARYLAGEAAAHPHTWSAIAQAMAALHRNELPPSTPDFVDIDHRRGPAMAPGDLLAYMRAAFDEPGHSSFRIETVHRLTELGAVITHVANMTSAEGVDAEWRITDVFTVEGDLVVRCEMFDEADLDAALARFDELDLK